MRGPASIQGRLLALVVGGVAAVWLAAAAWTWRDVRREVDELLDAHLAQAAALLVVQQAGEFEHGDDHDRAVDAPMLHRYATRAVFQVFDRGRLVLRSADAPREPLAAQGLAAPPGFTTAAIDGRDWRVFVARGGDKDVRVFVGERLDARESIVRAALRGTLWPIVLALPLIALLAWWAIRRSLAPLRTLGRTLTARPAGASGPVAVADAPSEVQPLVNALNGLFERIDAMLQSERRFTADAAHELRTPIAAIRAQAQVALGESDDVARRRALGATLAGCDRAAHLVEQLLTLSRLEAGAAVPRQPVELTALARQVAADLAPRALDKGQDLSVEAEGSCTVPGDPTLLAILLRNLLDNALRYSPRDARVRLTVRPEGDRGARLEVEDSGPGLSAEELKRLGQRFHRGLGHDESGSGLGWSIVRRIAEVHGFDLQAGRSATLGGLAITLRSA